MYDYEDHKDIDFAEFEPGKHRASGNTVRIIRTDDIYQVDPEEDMGVYSPRIVELAGRFDRAGIPEGCNAASMAGMSKHGERAVQLFAVIDPDTETFVRAGFRCRGDIATIAAASLAVEFVEGKTVDEALALTANDFKREMGKMPADRVTRPYLASCAIRAAIGDFYIRRGRELAWIDKRVVCDECSVECSLCQHCSLRDQRITLRFSK